MAPIPITIITGFLGSGKTTLLLNLVPQLRLANPDYRLALLKNEFGDVAVDSQLAASSAVSGVQELLNGCICCNLVGQLGPALAELRDSVQPNRIVVETSGSAFPATLAMEVNRAARDTGGQFVLDGVITVIDVENWKGYEDTSYTARVQARYTDLVVFNKWEDSDERRFDDCLDRLGDLEVDIAWVKSDRGRVPVDVVFGIDGGLARTLTEEEPKPKNGGHAHDEHEHNKHEHSHDHQTEVEVLSVTLRGEGQGGGNRPPAVNVPKLMALLNAAPKDEVYRIKSVLMAPSTVRSSGDDEEPTPSHDPPRRYILNWAFGRWTFTPLETGNTNKHESSNKTVLRMTVILARYESTKWKKRLESGGFLELDGGNGDSDKGELTVTKIA
ncbi:Uu.00g092500.m01.CDS01 [Anthostomella pinea]|uniref:Uu.00g092500.m01.CDS01 n=1 Tax=Anthostomella pinea TaxID=933095 RepID=A0AAI8VN94_9PEZI|nr:Uu.00g092500.m01.CDS01 [Anthostomella pinea]